jgi:AAA domain
LSTCSPGALVKDAIVADVHGVDVIPSARELAGVEMSLVGELGRERFLHDALEPVLGSYDRVVIDTPPNSTGSTRRGPRALIRQVPPAAHNTAANPASNRAPGASRSVILILRPSSDAGDEVDASTCGRAVVRAFAGSGLPGIPSKQLGRVGAVAALHQKQQRPHDQPAWLLICESRLPGEGGEVKSRAGGARISVETVPLLFGYGAIS